jgi:predicted PurR-regulated permease PerM
MTGVTPSTPSGPEWSPATRRLVVILVVGITFFLLAFTLSGLLAQLVLAALLAFLFDPLIGWLHRRLEFPRWLGILVVYLLIAAVTFFAVLILPVMMVNSLLQIDLGEISASFDQWVAGIAADLSTVTIFGTTVDLSPIIDAINTATTDQEPSGQLLNVIVGTITATAGVFGVAFSALGFIIFTLLIAIYLSGGARRFLASSLLLFPEPARPEARALGNGVNTVWNDYVRGQVVMGLIIGTTTWIVTWLLGVPGAFALGVIAGALECIPTFGPIIATIPAVIVALVQGSDRFVTMSNIVFTLIVIVAYVLIQQLESSILAPKVMGNAVVLPPILVLIAITAGLQVGGVLGAIIAVPVVATFKVVTLFLWKKAVPNAL